MAEIRTPATSANLGPGFDSMGMALAVYNTFRVGKGSVTKLINVEERFAGDDNLFLQAYRKGCAAIGRTSPVIAEFDCHIPITRGMGSSASMIIGGLMAASVLHDHALSSEDILQIACDMEGHPDNTAPCLLGGVSASLKTEDGTWLCRKLETSPLWHYTLLIPDFEISTAEARKILPESYPLKTAAANSARAVLMAEALRSGDAELLKHAAKDFFHDPYRKNLIHGLDTVRPLCEKDTDGVLLISGSGPACLLISPRGLSSDARSMISTLPHQWQILETAIAAGGTVCTEGDSL